MAGVATLAGCTATPGPGPGAGGSSGGGGTLTWWDQFNPLQDLQRATFDRFTESGGPAVDYTVYNPNDQGKALQLAFSSQQLPDVFSLAGVGVPPSVLLKQGWFSPLSAAEELKAALPAGSVIDGIHIFDGELYSFPIFSFRQYESLNWYNKSIIEKAGLDPDDPPKSWDDYRASAKKVQDSGTAGLLLPLKFTDRMAQFVLELAQTAGFPGSREGGTTGIDLTTGEYRFHDDAFVDAIDFLLSFQKDGTLFQASTSLDARAGRARWAAGASGHFFDGSYCAGVVAGDFAPFLDQLAVGPIPTPDGKEVVLTRAPSGGTFWVSGQSEQVDEASKLLQAFPGVEYQQSLAVAMDQAPLDLDSVAGSDAHATYKQAVELFKKQVFLGPTPQAKNPFVTVVEGAMAEVKPGLGDIIQGAFSGQVSDVRGALKQLSDATSATRDAAVKAKGDGKVSAEDWAFPSWKRGTDFGPDQY